MFGHVFCMFEWKVDGSVKSVFNLNSVLRRDEMRWDNMRWDEMGWEILFFLFFYFFCLNQKKTNTNCLVSFVSGSVKSVFSQKCFQSQFYLRWDKMSFYFHCAVRFKYWSLFDKHEVLSLERVFLNWPMIWITTNLSAVKCQNIGSSSQKKTGWSKSLMAIRHVH